MNSTLAAAVVAAKLGRPIAHVEAGLRSFDRTMPEEVNRRVTDVLSDLLFTTSPEAETNLAREGIDPGRIHFVGNPMIDTLLANLDRFDVAAARARLGLAGPYAVATLHRPANVDDPATAGRIVATLRGVAELVPLVSRSTRAGGRRSRQPASATIRGSRSSSRSATSTSCRWSAARPSS